MLREEVERLLGSCETEQELAHGLLGLLVDVVGHDPAVVQSLATQLQPTTMEQLTHGCIHDIGSALSIARCGLGDAAPELREILKEGMLRDAVRRRRIESILKAIEDSDEAVARTCNVVEDARMLRRAVERKKDDTRAPLAELVASVTRMVSRVHRDVVFRMESIPDVTLRAPQGAVFRVLLNLLENACQAVAGCERQEVRIRGWISRNDAFIEVADTGPGIPEVERERVFDPSFTTKHKGSGLGLFVSRALVSGWGGQLQLLSQPHEGTRLTFSAPFEEAP